MATTPKSTVNKNNAADAIFPAFPAAFMANLPSTPMNGYANLWTAYMTSATEINREFMKFVATRLQHDAELGESLAKCSDWADAASVHQDWVRKTSEEYMVEVETLMKIASTAQEKLAAAASADLSAINIPVSNAGEK